MNVIIFHIPLHGAHILKDFYDHNQKRSERERGENHNSAVVPLNHLSSYTFSLLLLNITTLTILIHYGYTKV